MLNRPSAFPHNPHTWAPQRRSSEYVPLLSPSQVTFRPKLATRIKFFPTMLTFIIGPAYGIEVRIPLISKPLPLIRVTLVLLKFIIICSIQETALLLVVGGICFCWRENGSRLFGCKIIFFKKQVKRSFMSKPFIIHQYDEVFVYPYPLLVRVK